MKDLVLKFGHLRPVSKGPQDKKATLYLLPRCSLQLSRPDQGVAQTWIQGSHVYVFHSSASASLALHEGGTAEEGVASGLPAKNRVLTHDRACQEEGVCSPCLKQMVSKAHHCCSPPQQAAHWILLHPLPRVQKRYNPGQEQSRRLEQPCTAIPSSSEVQLIWGGVLQLLPAGLDDQRLYLVEGEAE